MVAAPIVPLTTSIAAATLSTPAGEGSATFSMKKSDGPPTTLGAVTGAASVRPLRANESQLHISRDENNHLGFELHTGTLKIEKVWTPSAWRCGLRTGQLVKAVDGKDVKTLHDMRAAIGNRQEVVLTVFAASPVQSVPSQRNEAPHTIQLAPHYGMGLSEDRIHPGLLRHRLLRRSSDSVTQLPLPIQEQGMHTANTVKLVVKSKSMNKRKYARKGASCSISSAVAKQLVEEDAGVTYKQSYMKRGKSGIRFNLYRSAQTLGEALLLGSTYADVQWDLSKGIAVLTEKSMLSSKVAIGHADSSDFISGPSFVVSGERFGNFLSSEVPRSSQKLPPPMLGTDVAMQKMQQCLRFPNSEMSQLFEKHQVAAWLEIRKPVWHLLHQKLRRARSR